MIHKIKITNLSDAESYSFNKNNMDYDVWISVIGREESKKINRMRKNFKEKNVKFFHQFFADWSDEDGISWEHLKDEAPQLQNIQNIITFLKPFAEDDKPHKLGINCFAGISRSTAVGIIALVMSGRTIEEALIEIVKDRAIAWPNLRILAFASDILGIDVHDHVLNWRKKCMSSDEIFTVPDRMQKNQNEVSF
jgi:predicted protein tyrosine phosphatase